MQSSNKSETHCYGIIANIEKSLMKSIKPTGWLMMDTVEVHYKKMFVFH